MSLKENISNDMKQAMKSVDKPRLQTLRSLRAAILEFEKSGIDRDITPDDELKFLTTAAKKRKEAIEQFRNAGREELAEKEEHELKIIEEYLPKQLSEEEIMSEVEKIAKEVGAETKADFPKLMPKAIQALKGKADGKAIKESVEKYLSR